MKIYCPDCGNRLEYAAKKPNFCVNCGYAFAGAPPKKEPTPAEAESIEEDMEKTVDSPCFADMSALEIEMDVSPRKGVSLGDIMASTLEEEQVNFDDLPKPKVGKTSKEEVKKQFQAEAGAIRPRNTPSQED